MSFDLSKLPPKPPGEEAITEKQCLFILSLDESLSEKAVRKLGKWQARAIIKALLEEEKRAGMDEYEDDEEEAFVPMPQESKSNFGCGCLLAAAIVGGVLFLAAIIMPNIAGISKNAKATAAARSNPTPRPTSQQIATQEPLQPAPPDTATTPTPAPTPIPAATPFVPTRLKVEVSAKLEYGIARLKKGTPIEILKTESDGWTVRAQGIEFHVSRAQVE